MEKLPIGIQSFRKIREGNFVYVDKTKYALDLLESYQYVFLARPRRFGKSLFLNTLKEIFEGPKELFKGLYIYDKYDFPKHPVIRISWAGNLKTLDEIKSTAFAILRSHERKFDITCDERKVPAACLKELIERIYYKFKAKVVVLVDEYDKPILDNIEEVNAAREAREFLRGFYSVIKDADEYLRFAFITGVSRFSRVSIFSGINNLVDISLNPKFAYICGYLHENLTHEFKEYLKGVDLEKVRRWYNGYNFLGHEKLYNPFDILLFIDSGFEFKNYWFETATPSFLIKLLERKTYNLICFEHLEVDEKILSSFDVERPDLETIMFQSGYLTIKQVKHILHKNRYVLAFPNMEVRMSFNDYLLDYLLLKDRYEKQKLADFLYEVLRNERLKDLEKALKALFGNIAYTNFVKNSLSKYEGFYGSVFYAFLAGAGFEVIPEDITSQGRIDLTVILEDKVYIFEFKVHDEDPLRQIEQKNIMKNTCTPKLFTV